MTTPRARLLLVLGLLALCAQPTWGARPKTWQIDEPADFLAGNLENVSLSSRAELLLAPQTQRYELDPKEADTVNAVAIGPDKRPYIGTGPNGMVYRMVDHEPQKFIEVPEGQVFSLLFLDDGSLLVGTGGRRGVIYRVGPDGQRSPFWEPSAVRYIWSMARDAAGNIYAATGTSGEIYKISPEGKNATKIVSLTTSKNVLTLAFAGQNHLVFGTDGNGLLGQVNLQTGRVRILFDAGDRSVAAIAPLPDGTIYAATTRAGTDKGAGAGPALSRPLGRPDLPDAPVASRPAGRPNGADDEPADHDGPSTTFSASVGSATLPTARGERGASSAGSAVYRVDVNGLTTEVLSLPALFLSMTPTDSSLLVGTGSPGRVYLLQPNKERYVALVRDDAAFFSAAARVPANDASQTAPAAPDDSYWIGTSRPAALVHILPDYAHEGAYTSAPQDAGQIAAWGRITADLTLPPGTNVTVQTRSSNLRDAASPGWSDWSEPIPLGSQAHIASPPARFLQFRLLLKSGRTGDSTPIVRAVQIPYLVHNLAPEISSLSVTVPDSTAGKHTGDDAFDADSILPIEWQARDPNGDALIFEVLLRQVGNKRWIRIAKDVRKNSHSLDSNSLPDGRYEVRLVASDSPDNPPSQALSKARISDPFTVDNTPPRIEDLRFAPAGPSGFRIQAHLVDAASNLVAAQYAIDSAQTWITLLPTDEIFDTPSEMLDFTVGPLPPGEHILTLRAADTHGNIAHAWLPLTAE